MNVEPPPPRSSINAAERARREREVDFDCGKVRCGGGSLSDDYECHDAC